MGRLECISRHQGVISTEEMQSELPTDEVEVRSQSRGEGLNPVRGVSIISNDPQPPSE